MTDPPQRPPAGWHPDPDQPQTWRYWDGDAWTDQRAPMAPGSTTPTATRKGWRKMTWVLIAWCVLILIWAIAGGGSAAEDCEDEPTRSLQEACEAGTGIGILLILFIGFIGFCFLSIIWFMTRPREG